MLKSFLLLLATAGGGALAVFLAERTLTPPLPLHERDFVVTRDAEHPLELDASRCLAVPFCFGDFDLSATVEVPAGGELDLVLRRSELPHEERSAGHGRFVLLRLSATSAGPPWRTREQALFGDGLSGGVKVTAGYGATLQVQARGRRLTATVAGQRLPDCLATDDRGEIAFVVRGGTGLVRYLRITAVPRPGSWPPVAFGALAGAGLGCVCFALRAGWLLTLLVASVLAAGGGVAGPALLQHVLPRCAVPASFVALVGLWWLPLALGLALPRRSLALPLGLVAALAWLELAANRQQALLQPFEDPRLAACFGRGSGPAPFDALARRIASKKEIHVLAGEEARVLFLGGDELFQLGRSPELWVADQAAGLCAQKLGRKIEAVVMPTVDASAAQQLRLWRTFYLDWPARALVFGIPGAESEAMGAPLAVVSRSTLLGLWLARREAAPPPLAATLAEVRALCRERGLGLVLATGAALDATLAAQVAEFARQESVPLVEQVVTPNQVVRAEALATALAAALAGH